MDVSEMLLQIFQDLTSRQIHVSMISPMDNIYVAKHLSVHEGGFVSRHYIQSESCTLLVWKQLDSRLESDLSAPSFQIVSMIYLPICPARMPCIHFDGRRLIAFARDHIGFLVLIYHIRFGDDDDDFMFTSSPGRASLPGAQEHGNVYNVIRTPPYVRFACRIRHPSLGGLEDWDSIQMTCNDRFLVFNSKQGSGLDEAGHNEGLVVLDLKAAVENTNLSTTVEALKY
jgi:hypothetical protein